MFVNSSQNLETNTYSTQHISTSHHQNEFSANRVSRLKDKRTTFPQSTLNKIVFVSNSEGNGFQRQNYFSYQIPSHIDLQTMISSINQVCYNKWKQLIERLDEQPFKTWDLMLKIIGVLSILVILTFILLLMDNHEDLMEVLVYIFTGLLLIGTIASVMLMRQKRQQINKDDEMIYAIKKQLMRLNSNQLKEFSQSARFTWSCQKQCLWIAIEFH